VFAQAGLREQGSRRGWQGKVTGAGKSGLRRHAGGRGFQHTPPSRNGILHGSCDRDHFKGCGERRRNQSFHRAANGTAKRDARPAQFRCNCGDAGGRFAPERLRVQTALAVTEQLGTLSALAQSSGLDDDADSGTQLGVRNALKPKPRPPAAPAPGRSRNVAPTVRSTTSAKQPPIVSSVFTTPGPLLSAAQRSPPRPRGRAAGCPRRT